MIATLFLGVISDVRLATSIQVDLAQGWPDTFTNGDVGALKTKTLAEYNVWLSAARLRNTNIP